MTGGDKRYKIPIYKEGEAKRVISLLDKAGYLLNAELRHHNFTEAWLSEIGHWVKQYSLTFVVYSTEENKCKRIYEFSWRDSYSDFKQITIEDFLKLNLKDA